MATTDISFVSPLGGRVPARLVRPASGTRPPVVIFQHQLGADMAEFEDEAVELARRCGIAGILVAAPFSRPEPDRTEFNWRIEGRDAALQRQAIMDLRRVLDLLPGLGLDGSRAAYVGHSYGANWGGILSAVEPRYRAFVLMAGVGSVTGDMSGDAPPWPEIRAGLGPAGYERYRASLRAFDPDRYVGRARRGSLLFQFGHRDEYVSRRSAEAFAAAAGESHRVLWYDTDHDFSDQAARMDRRRFLAEQLRSNCGS